MLHNERQKRNNLVLRKNDSFSLSLERAEHVYFCFWQCAYHARALCVLLSETTPCLLINRIFAQCFSISSEILKGILWIAYCWVQKLMQDKMIEVKKYKFTMNENGIFASFYECLRSPTIWWYFNLQYMWLRDTGKFSKIVFVSYFGYVMISCRYQNYFSFKYQNTWSRYYTIDIWK